MDNEAIQSLKEALELSPENIPLRLHLADMLMQANRFAEAETELKEVLEKDKLNVKAKSGLAKTYFHLEKYSVAAVIFEELTKNGKANAQDYLVYAKVLIKENQLPQAVKIYQTALMMNPELKDEQIEIALKQPQYANDDDMLDSILDEANNFMEKPDINFDDVGGMERVKDEIEIKIIRPLQHPELYEAYGKKIGGGILLYGPPGCGKTYLAKATAGQVKAKFMKIGINDVLDMWIGNSEKQLHEIFEHARRNKPCVLFFDEVDALGASRTDMRHSAGRFLINQFLDELDGVSANNDGVLILAATNAPWHLDTAFRRPGRFDRIIFVEPPDTKGRELIMQIILQGKPIEQIDYNAIAKATADFSGADLNAVVDICIEDKLRDSFKTGKPEPIRTKDILNAIKKHKPTTKEWFNSARNYALYSNESGLYDDILTYLNIKK